jgi:KDO2-lipid IV(A) lauroyltransferase
MIILYFLLYYCVLIPVSVLPFPVLHLISSFFYVVLYYLVGYRKKVVMENLENAFPEKTPSERKEICRKFYKFLCDLVLETFKSFTISEKQLRKHVSCKNPEVVNKYFDQGKSVIIAVGHFNSWELLLTGSNLFVKHRMVVIYQPLSNPYYDRKLIKTRAKLGTMLLPATEVKQFFHSTKELNATVFAIDQSPSNSKNCYWMKFLNQETGVRFGMEKYAKEFNQPVIFARLNYIKRGYYELEFTEVTNAPQETAYGEITEKATKLLEQDILKEPELWLWSHKRWKHKR